MEHIAIQKMLKETKFVRSVPNKRALGDDVGAEVAFIGRSNTGKSSTLNALCSQKKLARTSRTPGRTQHFVVFQVLEDKRLIDLPGFGYAQASKTMRSFWKKEIPVYLNFRKSLKGLVLIMDSRHILQPMEQDLLAWCNQAKLSTLILLNKADKLKRSESALNLKKVESFVRSDNYDCSEVFLFSAIKKIGCEEVWTKMGSWLSLS